MYILTANLFLRLDIKSRVLMKEGVLCWPGRQVFTRFLDYSTCTAYLFINICVLVYNFNTEWHLFYVSFYTESFIIETLHKCPGTQKS